MRRLLILATLLAVLLAAFWLGGETLLARELRRLDARDPTVRIEAVSELREARRIGVQLSALRLDTPAGRLELPQADLWLAPLRPTEIRLNLPAQALLDLGAGPVTLGLTEAGGRIRLRPLAGGALDSAGLSTGPVTLDGAPLATSLGVTAALVPTGDDSPPNTMAAYDFALRTDRLDLARLTGGLPWPGPLQLDANGRVWLDSAPGPTRLAPGTRPLLIGLRIDRGELKLGPLAARLIGQLRADEQGRAEGRLALYTPDAAPLLRAAADAGLIPADAVGPAETVMRTLGAFPLAAAPGAKGDEAGIAGMVFPAPAPGELRLSLRLADGRMSLGPVPLGPAPVFPR
ncbi:hypothetical protein IT41_11675 [Paracoccus halophilus]|uniref:DUF2125 domain-containing protein n=1 Tax=Paracoccus halophilus TaxID=376733 RepID=A0A099F0F0_9RHOB|nr:DUF2125 domain-containing protein [Paracoccus halophilus]KGJ04160.1 hypothetical protein IT41_11675 [Paracoccus halophilus]